MSTINFSHLKIKFTVFRSFVAITAAVYGAAATFSRGSVNLRQRRTIYCLNYQHARDQNRNRSTADKGRIFPRKGADMIVIKMALINGMEEADVTF